MAQVTGRIRPDGLIGFYVIAQSKLRHAYDAQRPSLLTRGHCLSKMEEIFMAIFVKRATTPRLQTSGQPGNFLGNSEMKAHEQYDTLSIAVWDIAPLRMFREIVAGAGKQPCC